MSLPNFTSAAAKQFASLCIASHSSFHKELSIKLRPNLITDKRVLFGYEKTDKSPQQWRHFLQELQVPSSALKRFQELSPSANAFLCAIEEDSHTTLKIYLEFWEDLVSKIQAGTHQKQPYPLNRGFKWLADNPESWVEDTYWCYPMLSCDEIRNRLTKLLHSFPTPNLFSDFLDKAVLDYPEMDGALLIYMEIANTRNKRRSFDINCYKGNITLKEITSPLLMVAEQWKINHALQPLLQKYETRPLGHISGGLDRNNEPFLTLYLEC